MKTSWIALSVMALSLAAALLAGCRRPSGTVAPGAAAAAGPSPARVGGAEARALVAGGARLVDVRTPEEYAAGHVEGALNIPHDQVAARVGEIGAPDQPVVLYCRSGRRSDLAARALAELGYRQVHNLGPMTTWNGS